MEETVNEDSERGSESKRKPPDGGIKNVRGFKRGHPYLESRNTATSATREYSRVVHVTPGGLLTVPNADGICGNSKILRPRLD